jgi:hypothetical protein
MVGRSRHWMITLAVDSRNPGVSTFDAAAET